uniref:RNA-directed DNA polymerase, eukaryota, reverse transcriptase zinc-binding domain protein n=1 Tax=Tanacetum cinerariifolium TaxID=118510 RepID=A0A699HI38_TANCI|nr:RNA-directed DNA polymerase, eukaryota, reverse transcriptase zinc-binding domain protein [Tanacetum cinerariifolium]
MIWKMHMKDHKLSVRFRVYGTVVDVYIPNCRTKAGKRFAFVRFIKVDNVDGLVGNLCTLWIGRMHLHANVVQFERSPLQSSRASQPIRLDKIAPLFVSTVKGFLVAPLSASPAMVLDDSCMVTRDLGNYVMGEVKQFSSTNNLRVLLSNEGFHNVQLVYLGGLWVMIELKSSKSKAKFLNHVGVASWFNCLSNAQSDFVSRDRIVLVDIEGVPMHDWSRNTFYKIGSKWGEVLELEEYVPEMVYCSDDDSAKEMGVNQTEFSKQTNLEDESDSEAVFDTYFGDNTDELGNVADSVQPLIEKEISNDPFNIYDLFNKCDKEVDNTGMDSSIPFPPGFTPVKDIYKEAEQDMHADQVRGSGFKHSEYGSILEILDEMIKVGQTMGFSMDGCTKDMEKIIGSQGVHEAKLLVISVYAPQSVSNKRILWNYLSSLITRWNGESIVMGDFNEVRRMEERWGSVFNVYGAHAFNNFITNSGHLSDHRPILLLEVITDYSATPFRLYHIWFSLHGFEHMVTHTWNSTVLNDSNGMIRFKKKLQILKKVIRVWVADQKKKQSGCVNDLKSKLSDIDKTLDQGGVNDDLLLSPMECMKQLHDVKTADARDSMQKAKIQWAIEGDENSKFFHGIINRKRANLAVKGIMIDGEWATDLENPITRDEICNAVWGCGENKSPRPDGFTFEFFVRCNSSFIALISKSLDPKSVSDYQPISLIGSLYKVVTKILITRLSMIISDLISDVQTTFLPNRQILDGPFIINELLARCHHKKQRAMVFKVDFAKAYDSIRWDYLEDVLKSFGFGSKWCSWIYGSLHLGMAYILINGSPTSEFQFHYGLKQGDPLAPYLFILIMETLHFSFSQVIDAGIFTGVWIDSSLMISHLFYADDAVFIGEWSHGNLKGIMHMLRCFSLMSGLSIKLKKSHLLGVGIPASCVHEAATSLGCSVMKAPFKYLGIMVSGNMSMVKAWDDTVNKLKGRLSKWKLKTLSIGGRLTLLKSVLGSTPIYNMSLYKVPKTVLNSMEAIRRNFFNGIHDDEMRVAWVKWSKVLASKNQGGLGVSSFCTLNRALLVKWVWRFLSHDNSLWARVIYDMHGSNRQELSASHSSTWISILKEINILKAQGVDLISHCKICVGNGLSASFWNDLWIGYVYLRYMFLRLYTLDSNKECTVADKMNAPLTSSFRQTVRGGAESLQLSHLLDLLGLVILSSMEDQWIWDMKGDGVFRVKDVRILLDEVFLPNDATPTRWIKSIPIKVNVFAWKVSLDRLPTRSNLSRSVVVPSLSCPICNLIHEDTNHLLFCCG